MTGALDETVARHWLVDYLVTNIGLQSRRNRFRRVDARSGSGVARLGGAHR